MQCMLIDLLVATKIYMSLCVVKFEAQASSILVIDLGGRYEGMN